MGKVQKKRQAAGSGLLEAMVVIAILGVIASAGIPQLTDYLHTRRLQNILNEFQSAVLLARSEAIRRNTLVRLSPAVNDSENTWGKGWKVWIDQNANDQLDSNIDLILLSRGVLPTGMITNQQSGTNAIEFSGSGFIKNFFANNVTRNSINIQLCTRNSGGVISIDRNGLISNMRIECA